MSICYAETLRAPFKINVNQIPGLTPTGRRLLGAVAQRGLLPYGEAGINSNGLKFYSSQVRAALRGAEEPYDLMAVEDLGLALLPHELSGRPVIDLTSLYGQDDNLTASRNSVLARQSVLVRPDKKRQAATTLQPFFTRTEEELLAAASAGIIGSTRWEHGNNVYLKSLTTGLRNKLALVSKYCPDLSPVKLYSVGKEGWLLHRPLPEGINLIDGLMTNAERAQLTGCPQDLRQLVEAACCQGLININFIHRVVGLREKRLLLFLAQHFYECFTDEQLDQLFSDYRVPISTIRSLLNGQLGKVNNGLRLEIVGNSFKLSYSQPAAINPTAISETPLATAVETDSNPSGLSARDKSLLLLLGKEAILSEQLTAEVLGLPPGSHAIDVAVFRINEKLDGQCLCRVSGLGYKLMDSEALTQPLIANLGIYKIAGNHGEQLVNTVDGRVIPVAPHCVQNIYQAFNCATVALLQDKPVLYPIFRPADISIIEQLAAGEMITVSDEPNYYYVEYIMRINRGLRVVHRLFPKLPEIRAFHVGGKAQYVLGQVIGNGLARIPNPNIVLAYQQDDEAALSQAVVDICSRLLIRKNDIVPILTDQEQILLINLLRYSSQTSNIPIEMLVRLQMRDSIDSMGNIMDLMDSLAVKLQVESAQVMGQNIQLKRIDQRDGKISYSLKLLSSADIDIGIE